MTTYCLYLESGPRRRKTMVHVLDLLGCTATGPTTEEALDATPTAITAYRRFLHRRGEAIDPDDPFNTVIRDHITKGDMVGDGSPYITFPGDLEPPTDDEVTTVLGRIRSLREELAVWAGTQTDDQLDAQPESGGRTGRAILLHIMGATGGSLSAALGGAPGFSAAHGAATRGERSIAESLSRTTDMIQERVLSLTLEQRAAIRELPSGPRSLRKALRQIVEHDWNHLAELARRPGGPSL